MITKTRRIVTIMLIIVAILLVPLIAMQFTNEVNWNLPDFLVMGSLLIGTGLLSEYVIRKVSKTGPRIVIIAAVLILFLLVWAELAVGIFGTPFAGS